MNNDLYFIEIIANALGSKDGEASLKQAFEKIKSLGTKPEYENGFEQFRQFMDIVNTHAKKKESDTLNANIVSELIIDLATDGFEGSDEDKDKALRIIKSNPAWRKEYYQLVAGIKQLNRRPEGIEVFVSCGNKPFKSITFTEIPGTKGIDRVTAGIYNIVFAAGHLIWEGRLGAEHLLWAKAYPGKPVKLAASTAKQAPEPTKEVKVPGDDIIIRVFPGIESGRIEITMNTHGDSQ